MRCSLNGGLLRRGISGQVKPNFSITMQIPPNVNQDSFDRNCSTAQKLTTLIMNDGSGCGGFSAVSLVLDNVVRMFSVEWLELLKARWITSMGCGCSSRSWFFSARYRCRRCVVVLLVGVDDSAVYSWNNEGSGVLRFLLPILPD